MRERAVRMVGEVRADHDSDRAFLVDPAWDPDELTSLADDLEAAGLEVIGGFATHAHHDHLLWHPGFGDASRWASPTTTELASEALPDGFEIELVIHDGHAPGHTALWLPRQRVLLAGDMLSDVELPLPFWPDDVPAYLAGLDRLAEVIDRAELVVPGHGRVGVDPRARLDADRRYLDEVMRSGRSDDPRIDNDGMAQMHRHLRELLRGK